MAQYYIEYDENGNARMRRRGESADYTNEALADLNRWRTINNASSGASGSSAAAAGASPAYSSATAAYPTATQASGQVLVSDGSLAASAAYWSAFFASSMLQNLTISVTLGYAIPLIL